MWGVGVSHIQFQILASFPYIKFVFYLYKKIHSSNWRSNQQFSSHVLHILTCHLKINLYLPYKLQSNFLSFLFETAKFHFYISLYSVTLSSHRAVSCKTNCQPLRTAMEVALKACFAFRIFNS